MFHSISKNDTYIRNIDKRHLERLGLDGLYKATTYEDAMYRVYGIRTVRSRANWCCIPGPERINAFIVLAKDSKTIELSFRAFTALNPSKLSLNERSVGQCSAIIYGA